MQLTVLCSFYCRGEKGRNASEQQKGCFTGCDTGLWVLPRNAGCGLSTGQGVSSIEETCQFWCKSRIFLTQSVHAKSGTEELFGFCERVNLI